MPSTRILIVEDEILVAREIEDILQDLGYEVVAMAQDGETALQQVADTYPDLVLMDIVMPGAQDGIETADQIRSRFQIPVVYLTAYADSTTLERAKISEPFGYVLKPFQPPTLHSTIQIALTRHKIERLRLNTLRSNINAHLPHEMNTPLCVILASVDLLIRRHGTLSSAEVLEMLQSIYAAALRLDKMCQDFLLHTELEILCTNSEQLQATRSEVTNPTADRIRTWAMALAIEFDRADDLHLVLQEGAVQLSEAYLKRIVKELLDNAFNYSMTGTMVQVNSTVESSTFYLSIGDRGRGLAAEQIANLGAYIQFNREDYEQKGLGLGLSLIRRLIELHDGDLTMVSTIGEGTTVTVRLPAAAPISQGLE